MGSPGQLGIFLLVASFPPQECGSPHEIQGEVISIQEAEALPQLHLSAQPLKGKHLPKMCQVPRPSQRPPPPALMVEALNNTEAQARANEAVSTTKPFRGCWEVFSVNSNHMAN